MERVSSFEYFVDNVKGGKTAFHETYKFWEYKIGKRSPKLEEGVDEN